MLPNLPPIADARGGVADGWIRARDQTLEDELRDLNAEYKHVARTLQDPRAATDEGAGAAAGDAGLRQIVLRMEHKSAQLKTLRETSRALLGQRDAVRGELRRTRGALAQTAETAAMRWRRLKRIEGGGEARRR